MFGRTFCFLEILLEILTKDELQTSLTAVQFLMQNYALRTDELATDMQLLRNQLEAQQLAPSGKRTLEVAVNFYLDNENDPRLGSVEAVKTLQMKLWPNRYAKGGPGSGNFGHAGRPGEVGGSAPDPDIAKIDPQESNLMSKDIKELAMMVRYMRKELVDSGKKARRETRAILRKPFEAVLAEARKLPKGDKTREEIEGRVADTIGMVEYRVESILQNEMERNLQTLLGDKYDAVMARISIMADFEEAMDEEQQARNIERWWGLKPSGVGDQLDSFRMDEKWDGAFVEEAVAKAVDMRKGMVLEIMAQASKSSIKGGEGSGTFEHRGRPGEVGGSGPRLHQEESHVYEDIMQLVDLLRDGTPTLSTAEHARHVIEIFDGAYRSAASGQAVELRTTF